MTQKQRSNTENTPCHPVDRGWAWVILTACALTFLLFIGTMKSFGIYFVAFMEYFEANAGTASIISGVLQGVYSMFSLPIVTVGLKYLSCRQALMIAGTLGSISYLAGSFANKIEIIIFTHGVLYGLGFSFLHGPAAYLIGVYFNRRRNLANAAIVAAGGLGGLILPPIYRFLIDTFGLKGALLVTSGLLLNTVAMSMLLRPPGFYKRSLNLNKRLTENNSNNLQTLDAKLVLRNSPIVKVKEDTRRNRSTSVNVKPSTPENETKFGSLPYLPNRSLLSIENTSLYQSFTTLGSTDAMNSFSQLDLRHNEDVSHSQTENGKSNRKRNRDMQKVFDISLMTKPLMIIYMISYCLGSVGSAYGIIFAPAFAKDQNIGNQKIALLVSIMSGCDFGGRLISGFIADRKILKNYQLIAISQFITGVIMIMCSFYKEFWHFVIYAIGFGLFGGGIFALTPAIIVDFVGIDHFRSAFGLLVLGQGITLGSSSPLIGYLRDRTSTYTTSFYFMGALLFVSAFTLLLEPCARARQERSSKEKRNKEEEIVLKVDQ